MIYKAIVRENMFDKHNEIDLDEPQVLKIIHIA